MGTRGSARTSRRRMEQVCTWAQARKPFGDDRLTSRRSSHMIAGRVKLTRLNRTVELSWGWATDNGGTALEHAGIFPGRHGSR
eukprot:765606-Hanusia_phi.AAC.4